MLERRKLHRVVCLGHAGARTKIPNSFRRVAASTHTRQRGHARIVPTVYVAFLDQSQQLSLAKDRICEIKPVEFKLPGREDPELFYEPVIQRSIVFEFKSANRVSHLLD